MVQHVVSIQDGTVLNALWRMHELHSAHWWAIQATNKLGLIPHIPSNPSRVHVHLNMKYTVLLFFFFFISPSKTDRQTVEPIRFLWSHFFFLPSIFSDMAWHLNLQSISSEVEVWRDWNELKAKCVRVLVLTFWFSHGWFCGSLMFKMILPYQV